MIQLKMISKDTYIHEKLKSWHHLIESVVFEVLRPFKGVSATLTRSHPHPPLSVFVCVFVDRID